MAVRVTLKSRSIHSLIPTVDVFDHPDDEYFVHGSGVLEVRRAVDGTVKIYRPDAWSDVDGTKAPQGFGELGG